MVAGKEDDNLLKIGFLERKENDNLVLFKDNYDIVCTNNTSYNQLFKKVKILS